MVLNSGREREFRGGSLVYKIACPVISPGALPHCYEMAPMRKLIVAILMATGFSSISACTAAETKVAPGKQTLGIGDPAPPLKVMKWLQGEEVKEFTPGKVYVVEFWATWCGPCINAMPHLVELQEEFKKDLVVIGMTSKDSNGNTKESVEKFIEKNKSKFTYRFAYSDDRETDKAYMEAAKQDGIPCSFVVDKAGKIAYIGHPMELDEVLPKVIAGTWKGQDDIDAIGIANNELDEINKLAEKKPEEALPKLLEFEKAHASKAKQDMFGVQKMVLLMKAKKFDDAKVVGEALLAKSLAKKSAMPGAYTGMILADKDLNPDKKYLDLATKSLDTALQFDDKNVGLFLASMELQLVLGNKEKAAEYGKKAIDAEDDTKGKKQIEKIIEMKLKGSEK
jgi:thiol-disulfide isomerase/thioredoxin